MRDFFYHFFFNAVRSKIYWIFSPPFVSLKECRNIGQESSSSRGVASANPTHGKAWRAQKPPQKNLLTRCNSAHVTARKHNALNFHSSMLFETNGTLQREWSHRHEEKGKRVKLAQMFSKWGSFSHSNTKNKQTKNPACVTYVMVKKNKINK